MTTGAPFERGAQLETDALRVEALQRMSYPQLRQLLGGNPARAVRWVRSAAAQGSAAAQLRLGRMLLEGCGVPADREAAFQWFARAAAGGDDAEAYNMLGRCHEHGWGTPLDLNKAAHAFAAAAARGDAWGEYNLGNLLFDGRGVHRDRSEALYWYLSAARRGHARAMNLAGRCLEEGWGCTPDPHAAGEWYRRSAEAGYFRAQFNYALLLIEGGRAQEARAWLEKAAQGGDEAMLRAVSSVLARGGLGIMGRSRGMAQSGSASALGAEGRGFKSLCPDHSGHMGDTP